MIIKKVPFSEEYRNQITNVDEEAKMELELMEMWANEEYVHSFGKNINMTYTHEDIPDGLTHTLKLSEKDKETVRQAILSDVQEILTALTKEDIEELMRAKIREFEKFNPKNENAKKGLDRLKEFYTPNYSNCFNIIQNEILFSQISAYDYYRIDNLEVINLIEQKVTEWYEMPSDSKDGKKTLKELPRVKRAPTPEKYILPTYKLVDTLFSGEFPIGIEKAINMASEKDNRKGKTAYTLMMLNFDELGDGIKISRELSVYDQQVWNACVNLILNSYKIITPSQIYRWMGYEKQMNDRDKKRIMESVNAIIRARVFIDNENERKLYKNYPAISINTPLLAAKIVTAKSGKNEVTAIEIIEIPDLFAVAEERGQITTIPFEVLEISEIDRTEENLKLLTYLVRRIIHMKYDNDTSRKILLQAIYAKCDIKADERMKRKRLPEKIERIFNHYKKIKWIDGYELTDTEVTVKLPKKK